MFQITAEFDLTKMNDDPSSMAFEIINLRETAGLYGVTVTCEGNGTPTVETLIFQSNDREDVVEFYHDMFDEGFDGTDAERPQVIEF